VLWRKRGDESFTTELAWAFVKYKVSDEVSVQAGRVVLPSFLISEYQNVGCANTMVRPPVEMHGPNPLENVDGADVTWHSFGDTTVTAQAVARITRGRRTETNFQAPVGLVATGADAPRLRHSRCMVFPRFQCLSWIARRDFHPEKCAHAERKRKKGPDFSGPFFVFLVRLAGIEPTTPWFVAKYSIQLSYSRKTFMT
jgi:hypothetical protein